MQLIFTLFFTSSLLTRVTVGVPVSASSTSSRNAALPRSNQSRDYRSIQQPSFNDDQPEKLPLLKQVFTTITRKHDNLNTANIDNQRNENIKYQSGPSFEAEGSEVKSDQSELSNPRSGFGINFNVGIAAIPQDGPSNGIRAEGRAPLQQFGIPLDLSLPQQALLDQVQGNSAQAGHALSDSNQFDQVQHIDQTLYQPSQPSQDSEPSQTSSTPDTEDSDSDSGCRSCRRRHRGRRHHFGRRY